jgi:hypothetical protein
MWTSTAIRQLCNRLEIECLTIKKTEKQEWGYTAQASKWCVSVLWVNRLVLMTIYKKSGS